MIYHFDGLSFQILTIDRFLHKDGFFYVKARPYASLSFRVKGTGCFEIGDKSLTTEEGDVFFLPADTPYKVEYSGSESIVIHFADCNYREAENIEMEGQNFLYALFYRLLREWNERRSVNQAKSIIYEILESMEKGRRALLPNTAVSNCVSYIERHFCDPMLDIAEVCAAHFISQSSLQRAFKTHLGVSPKQYLIKLRMNQALDLLMKNEMTIKEIAYACGFSDEKFFSVFFKEKFGYSPSQIYKHITP